MAEDDEDGYHRFIISWDDLGVEAVHDINAEQSKRVEAALREEAYEHQDPVQLLEMILLRARFNTPRNYNVYAINMPDHLTEDAVRLMFEENPEIMFELVKKKGVKFY